MRVLLSRLAAGDVLATAVPGIYGSRLAELESQWRHRLGS
jgi:hypothetical protein